MWLVYLILTAIIIMLLSGIRIIKEWEKGLILTFGRFSGLRKAGLTYIFPIVQMLGTVDTRIKTMDVEPQECITSDSVTVVLDAVFYFKVVDAKKAVLNVEEFEKASFKLCQTSLRDVVGKRDLDELLQKKDIIGGEVKKQIQEPTDEWGIEVTNVEIKDVVLPKTMKRAMAKEAEAIREKRARVTKAEGELEASKKLKEASNNMDDRSITLRQLQTWQEIGAEQNSTMIIIPSDIISGVKDLFKKK